MYPNSMVEILAWMMDHKPQKKWDAKENLQTHTHTHTLQIGVLQQHRSINSHIAVVLFPKYQSFSWGPPGSTSGPLQIPRPIVENYWYRVCSCCNVLHHVILYCIMPECIVLSYIVVYQIYCISHMLYHSQAMYILQLYSCIIYINITLL